MLSMSNLFKVLSRALSTLSLIFGKALISCFSVCMFAISLSKETLTSGSTSDLTINEANSF